MVHPQARWCIANLEPSTCPLPNPIPAPTLSAVAERAGVSSITVSRVVRLPELVAPETRSRVEAAMRELGYVPNQIAGALAGARTKSVGVLVPTIANSIFADTVQGLSDELEPLGYAVILAQSRYDAAREDRMLSALLSRRPEAIIMVGSPATEDGARLLRRAGIPVVETWELPPRTDRCGGRLRQLRGGRRRRAASARAGTQAASLSSAATIPARRGAGTDFPTRFVRRGADGAAPAGAGSQRLGQRGRARGVARRRCGVRRQRCACDRLHVGPAQGRAVARRSRHRAAGRRDRPRRSRNGPADRANSLALSACMATPSAGPRRS